VEAEGPFEWAVDGVAFGEVGNEVVEGGDSFSGLDGVPEYLAVVVVGGLLVLAGEVGGSAAHLVDEVEGALNVPVQIHSQCGWKQYNSLSNHSILNQRHWKRPGLFYGNTKDNSK
jgi:hypothetical protein